MKRLTVFVTIVLILAGAGRGSAAETIRIAGAGGMIPLVTELAKAFMTGHKNVQIEVNQKSIESTGGIMSAAQGTIEIGMSARELKEDEQKLGLQAFEIARVATVVGVNKSVPLKDVSSENLCNIYRGGIKSWKALAGPDEKIFVLTRPDKDATKESVRKGIRCFANLKEDEHIVIVPTAPEMAKILASRPFSIGFTDAVAVDDSKGEIAPLQIDGISPTPENVRSGRYKVMKPFILLTKGSPAGGVREFIDYVKGPEGAKIMEANKAVAVK